MDSIIIISSIIVGTSGLVFAIKTLIDTRKKYYKQFLKERENRRNINE